MAAKKKPVKGVTITRVSFGCNIQLANYQHARVEAEAQVNPGDDPSVVLEELRAFVANELRLTRDGQNQRVVRTVPRRFIDKLDKPRIPRWPHSGFPRTTEDWLAMRKLTNQQIRKHVAELMLESAIREDELGRHARAREIVDYAGIIGEDDKASPWQFHHARMVAMDFAPRAAQDLLGAGEEGYRRVREAI